MKDRHSPLRSVASANIGVFALTAALSSLPHTAAASIFRDVLSSVGLAKPDPAPNTPTGVPSFPRQGYACCDMHFNKDWFDDGNYAEYPMIAAGTPVEVVSYGWNKAVVKIDGKPMRLGHQYGRNEETLDVWVNKVVVNTDPRPRISSYPSTIQEAIRQGKVAIGMSREQAIVAVGYPMTGYNGSLDTSTWKMWRSTHEAYELNFSPDGHLASVTGDDSVTSQVVYRPGR